MHDIKLVSTTKLKGNPDNPRTVRDEQFEQLKKSIEDFPQMLEKRPLVVVTHERKLMVLGGNQRLRAIQELGIKKVPVMMADDWTEEQRREFIVKDNVSIGEWDAGALRERWGEVDLAGWGVQALAHDWTQLPTVEGSPENSSFAKDQMVVVKLTPEQVPERRAFKDQLAVWLSENFSGCEVQ